MHSFVVLCTYMVYMVMWYRFGFVIVRSRALVPAKLCLTPHFSLSIFSYYLLCCSYTSLTKPTYSQTVFFMMRSAGVGKEG